MPLCAPRIADLGPANLIHVECPCSHTEWLTAKMLETAGVGPVKMPAPFTGSVYAPRIDRLRKPVASLTAQHMEDLERYLDEIVDPTIAEFASHPTSRRNAFLACVTTCHAVDYLAYRRKSPSQMRQVFCRQPSDFDLVDRVAHAFKHVMSGHPNSPEKPPLGAEEVIPRPPAFWGVAIWGLSRWRDQAGGVTLEYDHDVDLLDTVKRAAQFPREQTQTPSSP
jgi:hypothetical protein